MHNSQSKTSIQFENKIHYSDYVINKLHHSEIELHIDGIRCGSCVWLIENSLSKLDFILSARINMTLKKIRIVWKDEGNRLDQIISFIHRLGYRVSPYEADEIYKNSQEYSQSLLMKIAAVGFGFAQVMMLSAILWLGALNPNEQMTKMLLNLIMMLITVPITIYSASVFTTSALRGMKNKILNMDCAISIGIIATILISVQETIRNTQYTYYDSVLMLIFILLIGRFFDNKMRAHAQHQLHTLMISQPKSAAIMVDNHITLIRTKDIKIGDILFVTAGETIAADGIIIEGISSINNSLITGESTPIAVNINSTVHAGTINVSAPIKIRVQNTPQNSTIAEILRMVENAEQKKSKFVILADKLANLYTPFVLIIFFLTFLFSFFVFEINYQESLLRAVAVLLITCPCALALAVPVVQIASSSFLMSRGVLLKSADALERILQINSILLDKTGTLTNGELKLINEDEIAEEDRALIYQLSLCSKHPVCRAIQKAWNQYHNTKIEIQNIEEEHGMGIIGIYNNSVVKLGNDKFCFNRKIESQNIASYFVKEGGQYYPLYFADTLRSEAKIAIKSLISHYEITILSGDKESIVKSVANNLDIKHYYAEMTPKDKYNFILSNPDKKFLMIGDGLNDAIVLKGAYASISMSSGSDITKNSADFILINHSLTNIQLILETAHFSQKVAKQNLYASIIYNILAIPIAFFGYINPIIAALAMSISSIGVILNAMRCKKLKPSIRI